MEHHLQIVVLPEYSFVPFYGLSCSVEVVGNYASGNFAGKTGTAADKVLVVLFYNLV